jgi:3-dehydro-L-gulonate 2-dehydrogenase
MLRIPYEKMCGEFRRVLIKRGFTEKNAELSARLYADASRDGVYTHGLNRFPKFIASIDKGCVDISAAPVLTGSFGTLERYDGKHGPGNLNACFCMNRAIEIAKKNAVGCVALSNTNHWMRPGNYGLMAAEQNCIGILWTNTVPNMPPWGGREARLGNNPVVFAIPHGDTPVLVDVAMSMFSYGKLESYAREGRELPVDGGFNEKQEITKNAAEILKTHQCLPIGYWKGSGLSLSLDLIAATLSGGRTSRMVGELPAETELSQIFVAISLDCLPDSETLLKNIDETLKDMETSAPVDPSHPVHFPGEHMKQVREENMKLGIPVDEGIWQKVCEM